MRSEKPILLRHLVALLAISSSASWIYPGVQALLKFSPIKEITLGTEVTIDWIGQPSLGNVHQAVVLMKDGNALLTLCEGQITGSGQCSFELGPEHQVLGDGYQLAMQGKDGVALDYSGEFSIKAAEVKAEEASSSGEEKAHKDEDEVEIEEESKEEEDMEEQGDRDDDDEKVEKKSNGHDDEEEDEEEDHGDHDDDHEDENHEEDSDQAGYDDDNDDEEEEDKERKDTEHKHKHHSAQNSEKFNEHPTEGQDHHHHNHKQQKKKQHSKHHKQQQEDDDYYRQQADKQLKKILQKHQQQQQQWFTVQSTLSPKQRAKEAARLLERNRRRRQMMLAATRQKYVRLRREALGLQMSMSSVFDQLMPASAQAAEPPKVNKNIGIQPVLGNDAHVELMPERPIVAAVVAGDTDEMDIELADELDHNPLYNKDTNDKTPNKQDDDRHKKDATKQKRAEEMTEETAAGKKDKKEEHPKMKDNVEPSAWDMMWGGIAAFGKNVGAIVADGFAKVKQAVVGGGAATPEGEL